MHELNETITAESSIGQALQLEVGLEHFDVRTRNLIASTVAQTLRELQQILSISSMPNITLFYPWARLPNISRKRTHDLVCVPPTHAVPGAIKISPHVIENWAKRIEAVGQSGYILARIRTQLAHEMFHYYQHERYPAAHGGVRMGGSNLRNELAANLFALRFLERRENSNGLSEQIGTLLNQMETRMSVAELKALIGAAIKRKKDLPTS